MSHSDELRRTNLTAVEPNELVDRALTGCADAFTELSARFRPRLIRLLENRFRRRRDAEDIAQEALARAFARLDSFNPRYRFSTWLFTIAIRMAYDHARADRRSGKHVPLDGVTEPSADGGVEVQLQRRDELHNLWGNARQLLSESQYTAMWLRYGEERSVQEIARIMGKTNVGVRVLLHRARSILVTHLASP